MRSSNFGSLTGLMGLGKMGMGTRVGMPRMKPGKGLGVPSMGGLGVMRLARGGLADGGNPSMTYISSRDALHGMPMHTIPDYLMARLADGGAVDYGLRGRPDPFGYPKRALSRQVDDLDLARMELEQRPTRGQPRDAWRPGDAQRSPQLEFSQRGRIDQDLEQLMAQRGMENPEESGSIDPSDIALGASGARGAAGLLLPGPAMGGLAAMLYSGEAGAPQMRKDKPGLRFDPRVIQYLSEHPEFRHGPIGMRLRRLLGARD